MTRRVGAILLVAAVFAGVAGTALFLRTPAKEHGKSQLARIKDAVDMFRVTVGRKPESLDELVHPPADFEPFIDEADLTDAEGHRYRLEPK